MNLEAYSAYVIASLVIMAAPGPTVVLIASHAMAWGVRRALYTILGVSLSCSMLFTAFAFGAAAFLGALAGIFFWIKLAGCAYLIWLGVQQWRAGALPPLTHSSLPHRAPGWLVLQGFAVNVTNPKSLIFFAAFLPPFLNPSVPAAQQLLIMGSTFVAILLLISVVYAVAGARAVRFVSDRGRSLVVNRVSGTLLVGTGLALAATRRE